MVAPISSFRLCYPALALVRLWASVGHANADPTGQKSLQFLSSFEESRRDRSERYIWRNSESEVSLSVGGRLSIRTNSGSEVHIGFFRSRRPLRTAPEPFLEAQFTRGRILFLGLQCLDHAEKTHRRQPFDPSVVCTDRARSRLDTSSRPVRCWRV